MGDVVFRHAVASFEPTADAVLLWTRLTGATSVDWVLAADPQLRQVVARGSAATGPARDGTVTVDATGLSPATTYWYRFRAGDEDSPVGRTRTLPAGPTSRMLLGLVCCARYAEAPLAVYRAVAQRDVDLVLHLGDYVYEDDGEGGRRGHRPAREASSLQDYRERLAQMREDPDCQALHLRHPVVAMWDDHDLADNAWRGGAKSHDETEHGPWSARTSAAARARAEWVPSRLPDPDRPLVTWRSVLLGDLAELVLLDARLTGRDQPAGDDGAAPLDAPGRSLLGQEQRGWLRARLADTARPWAVVASSVVVNPMPLRLPGARYAGALLPEGYAVHGDEVLRSDQWDGYPREREQLVEWLAARRAGGGATLLLSGDVHSSWAFEGPAGPDGEPLAVEVTVPAVSSSPMGRSRLPGSWRLLDAAVRRLEHVRWVDVTERGFVLLELTPDAVRAAWQFVDPYARGASPRVALGTALRSERGPGPARWLPADPPQEQDGRFPVPLPPRPTDLPGLRRRHLLRRVGVLVAPLLLAAGGTLVLSAARSRGRDR